MLGMVIERWPTIAAWPFLAVCLVVALYVAKR